MEERELICIGCPMGCELIARVEGLDVTSVVGNHCGIGYQYAKQELIHPERMVTSTVVIEGGILPRLCVKTSKSIPKDKIFSCMKEIDKVRLKAPIERGTVILADVCGTGADIIATRSMEPVTKN